MKFLVGFNKSFVQRQALSCELIGGGGKLSDVFRI